MKVIPETVLNNIIDNLLDELYEITGNPDLDIQIHSIEKDESDKDDDIIRYYVNFEVSAPGYSGYENDEYYGIPLYFKEEYPSVYKKGYIIVLHNLRNNNYILEGIVYD